MHIIGNNNDNKIFLSFGGESKWHEQSWLRTFLKDAIDNLSLSLSLLFPRLSLPLLHVLMCLNHRGNAADVIAPDSSDD